MNIRELRHEALYRIGGEPVPVGRVGTEQARAEPKLREPGKALRAGAHAVHVEIRQHHQELALVMDALQLARQRMDVEEMCMPTVVQLGEHAVRITATLQEGRDQTISICHKAKPRFPNLSEIILRLLS